MSDSTSVNELLDALAKVLLRCFVLGAVLLSFWFVLFLVAGNCIHEIHGKWFSMTPHEFDLICYCGMGLVKLFVLLFFLFPYIAIRCVLRKRRVAGA